MSKIPQFTSIDVDYQPSISPNWQTYALESIGLFAADGIRTIIPLTSCYVSVFPLPFNHLHTFTDQKGFTLIELVMVIVILGVLASVALPKFVDLKADAQDAATKGVAGAISSASAINYGARSVNSSKGQVIADCTDAYRLLEGGLPSGYSVGGGFPPTPVPAGTTVNCTLNGPNNTSAIVAVTGIL